MRLDSRTTSVRVSALLAGALLLPIGTLAAQREPASSRPPGRAGEPGPQRRPGGAPRPGEGPTTATGPAAGPAAAACALSYERAHILSAPAGKPDGQLGVESLTLKPGETTTFVTDWKFEKQRGEGATRYGSHLRRARNVGTREVRLRIRSLPESMQNTAGAALVVVNGIPVVSGIASAGGSSVPAFKDEQVSLAPAQSNDYRSDLVRVDCP